MPRRSDDDPTIVKKACCCGEKQSAHPEPAPDRLATESDACCGGKPTQEHQAETDRAHSVRGRHGRCGSEQVQPCIGSDAPPLHLER